MHTHQITQISEGIFETILGFPEQDELLHIIVEESIPYVLLIDLKLGDFTWKRCNITGVKSLSGLSRNIKGDFVVSTNEFIEKYKDYSWQYAIQCEKIPPNYFDFYQVTGKQRYKILKECGFRFIVQSQPGGGDYVSLITQSEKLLNEAIAGTTV